LTLGGVSGSFFVAQAPNTRHSSSLRILSQQFFDLFLVVKPDKTDI